MIGNNKGYTLIELMVAVGIFAVVVAVTSGAFVVSLRGQRKAITVQNVAGNTRYATETIAKELRMMQVTGASHAVQLTSANCPPGDPCISFSSNMEHRDPNAELVFYLDTNTHRIMFSDDAGNAPAEQITAASIDVNNLEFDLTGAGDPGNHPRITIIMNTESNNVGPDVDTKMTTETTVSPRSL